MAQQEFYPQAIMWGRSPDGRFTIMVNMQVPTNKGGFRFVPVTTFFLTKEEEQSLKASLTGLHVASSVVDASNGHNQGREE